MRDGVILLVVFVLLVGTVAATGATSDGTSESLTSARTQVTEPNASAIAPGARLAGTISVQGVELREEHRYRALEIDLTRASGNDERATIVATTATTLDERLTTLETRFQRLTDARETNTPGDGRYRAQIAAIVTEGREIEHTTERLRSEATRLSTARLDARGTSVAAIDRLADRASALATSEGAVPGLVVISEGEPEPGPGPVSSDDGSSTPSVGERPADSTDAGTGRPSSAPDTADTDDTGSGDADDNASDDNDGDDDSNDGNDGDGDGDDADDDDDSDGDDVDDD